MSCCGNKRAAYVQQQATNPQSTRRGATPGNPLSQPATPASQGAIWALPPVASKMWADWHFENTGETTINLSGAVTGKQYHWAGKGAVQAMDYRDAGKLGPYQKILKRVM